MDWHFHWGLWVLNFFLTFILCHFWLDFCWYRVWFLHPHNLLVIYLLWRFCPLSLILSELKIVTSCMCDSELKIVPYLSFTHCISFQHPRLFPTSFLSLQNFVALNTVLSPLESSINQLPFVAGFFVIKCKLSAEVGFGLESTFYSYVGLWYRIWVQLAGSVNIGYLEVKNNWTYRPVSSPFLDIRNLDFSGHCQILACPSPRTFFSFMAEWSFINFPWFAKGLFLYIMNRIGQRSTPSFVI